MVQDVGCSVLRVLGVWGVGSFGIESLGLRVAGLGSRQNRDGGDARNVRRELEGERPAFREGWRGDEQPGVRHVVDHESLEHLE